MTEADGERPGALGTMAARTESAASVAFGSNSEKIYILITQCLQNDFFLNLNCRLSLPADAAGKLLIHPKSEKTFKDSRSRREIDAGTLSKGPLGRLLEAT